MRSSDRSRVHTRKIILQCLLVTIPMLVSSIVLLWIVYANLVTGSCPSEELCPESDIINTTSAKYYYIDFPTARLAFISSASSTVSLALIGFLMAMYAYVTAAALLRTSKEGDHENLPSPYQMSVLLQILNAELLVLWDLAWAKFKRVFWKAEKNNEFSRSPAILENAMMVLLAGIIASLFVQAANVYFHIAAEAVELVQVQEMSPTAHEFSRGLAPWCLNRSNQGDLGPKNYWGCAISAQRAAYNNATSLAPTNASTIQDMKNGVSDQHKAVNFTDSDGVQYALIGPANADSSMDWKASSFAVSTTCSAIPEGGCDLSQPITNAKDGRGGPVMLVPFNCTIPTAGIDIKGNLTAFNTATHMLNFHKYAAESTPFFSNTLLDLGDLKTALGNISRGENPDTIFKNNWSVLVMRKIPSAVQGDFSQLPPSFPTDTRIWKHNLLGAFVLLRCSVTVWEITYLSTGRTLTIVSKTPSNGTTAGIASMPGTRFVGTLANVFQDESTGPVSRSSPDNFIRSFELGMSKAYSYPLASQLSSRPSLLAQSRVSKVVTRLPVAALWLLVATNTGYALLGVWMAVWAGRECNWEVGQVRIRLGVVGLVAAVFEREGFEKAVDREEGLFEEKVCRGAKVKGIGFVGSRAGGLTFAVCE